jgi:ATP-dependent Zn protease
MTAPENIAYHEAGHAVAYFELGQRVVKDTIVPSSNYKGCCFGYGKLPKTTEISLKTRQRIEHEIIVLFCGALAERRLRNKRPRGWTKLTDSTKAVDLACYVISRTHGFISDKQLNAYLNWLYETASGLIYNKEESWKTIKAIAESLLENKTISDKEAHEIGNPMRNDNIVEEKRNLYYIMLHFSETRMI